MAGELSLLFRTPETCWLKGLHIQAHVWRHRPGRHYADVETYPPGRHYAALYFSGMEQTVADPQYHERWVCSDCVCHISLAADDELPDYNPRREEELRRALQEWKRSHGRVEATLLYRDLEDWVNSEERIVLDIIADGETVLSGLLNLLREIHLGHGNPPERGYHVSATDPGTVQWRFEPPQELPYSTVGGAPAHQPAAPSTGGATSSGDVGIAQLGGGRNNYNPWKESSPTGATSSAAGALASAETS